MDLNCIEQFCNMSFPKFLCMNGKPSTFLQKTAIQSALKSVNLTRSLECFDKVLHPTQKAGWSPSGPSGNTSGIKYLLLHEFDTYGD